MRKELTLQEKHLTDEEIGDYLAEIQLEEMKIKKWEEEERVELSEEEQILYGHTYEDEL